MSWFTTMTWYQQTATAFFLGFLPSFAVSVIIRANLDERKIRKMSFAASGVPSPGTIPASYKGILVRPNRDPVTPTIVFAPDYNMFASFCLSCRVNANSRNVVFAGQHEPTPFTRGTGFSPCSPDDKRWEHVAFLAVNPVSYYNIRNENAWYDIERMRRNNQFTRAFYYPELRGIVPNVTDEGRSWDLGSYGAKTDRTSTSATSRACRSKSPTMTRRPSRPTTTGRPCRSP